MADNTRLNSGSDGDLIATDDIGGVKYQRVKVTYGEDGVATDADGTNPLPVKSGTNQSLAVSSATEVPVSVSGILTTSSAESAKTNLLFRFLDSSGNDTGETDAKGNYTVASSFFIAPSAGQVFHIERMLVSVRDTGSFDSGKYGNNITLTNGIKIEKRQGASTTLIDLVDGQPIKTNADWGKFCHDVLIHSFGVGDEYMTVRWTFGKSGGDLRLVGDNSERFAVILEDDFTGLTGQWFKVQGYIV